ncbi:ABC transporter permease [Dermatophilus congolensis]|uniref:Putative osmoprotectant uptake system permease protein yehY n=1 Tax=Dermatophilus congolensis TaxID=1863 RepID=A0A239V7V0_9MICO|nr:ABC transporter permease subunit [Dermatophilus congolensis]MBO3130456.1 ABC transporter permease subunit [Dermatophilus congolensis]MBO3130914.1 ABC transporter permease subunit [Dermatophilus congolensis]MBO3134927.1 ABC transporter permease subunit [Dermatophilus congolensis]MBO3137167.1 ABC transporter permease subunit [Dermatophilus congolensis]MBO3139410.1 ABC transporter permease subunit [Dermatophilus congolensis]
MNWLYDNWTHVLNLTTHHALLAATPLLIGLLLAIPLGRIAHQYRHAYQPIILASSLLYTIPSLAMFILMPLILGTKILDPINVIVAMTLYTLALLVRTIADALNAIDDTITQAATAMGIGPLRRFLTIELPLATPIISAGLRVAAISNVSIVSVAAIIGVNQLGTLFTDGFARTYPAPIIAGTIACILLALLFDLTIVVLSSLATPWTRKDPT